MAALRTEAVGAAADGARVLFASRANLGNPTAGRVERV